MAGKKNLVVGIFLVFLAFTMLSSLWIVAPQRVEWNSPFPCCFILEIGFYNLLFGLLMERSPAPRLWAEMSSWLALAAVLLPGGLFAKSFLHWGFGGFLIPLGIWGGLVSALVFLIWPPGLSG